MDTRGLQSTPGRMAYESVTEDEVFPDSHLKQCLKDDPAADTSKQLTTDLGSTTVKTTKPEVADKVDELCKILSSAIKIFERVIGGEVIGEGINKRGKQRDKFAEAFSTYSDALREGYGILENRKYISEVSFIEESPLCVLIRVVAEIDNAFGDFLEFCGCGKPWGALVLLDLWRERMLEVKREAKKAAEQQRRQEERDDARARRLKISGK